jgi:DNA mismatch repair protein MutL
MAIRELSPLVVNQIAAGEVVERPASVVKELVENAFDAAATRIEIDLEGGGRDRIRIIDNGCGINHTELALAVAPHATSKIVNLDDLESVMSMGFRGEALASIASVSRLAITSRVADEDSAWTIDVEGTEVGEPRPAAAPTGTAIDVKTLFFNTPARRRFLKSERAETARVSEIVRTLALSRPGIAMRAARFWNSNPKTIPRGASKRCSARVISSNAPAKWETPRSP